MLTELYIEALLVDEDLADQVWEAWDKGEFSDAVAAWLAWSIIASENLLLNLFIDGQENTDRI